MELLAKVRNLPFDRLRVNGLRLKLFSFSVRGELVEPQKNTFARASVYHDNLCISFAKKGFHIQPSYPPPRSPGAAPSVCAPPPWLSGRGRRPDGPSRWKKSSRGRTGAASFSPPS